MAAPHLPSVPATEDLEPCLLARRADGKGRVPAAAVPVVPNRPPAAAAVESGQVLAGTFGAGRVAARHRALEVADERADTLHHPVDRELEDRCQTGAAFALLGLLLLWGACVSAAG